MALGLESAKKNPIFFYFFIEKTATRYTLFARYISGAHCMKEKINNNVFLSEFWTMCTTVV